MFDRSDPEIRIALMQAAHEAREMDHRTIEPEHLLLGLLTNVRGGAYRVLTAHGMQFDAAREALLAACADRRDDAGRDETSSSLDDDRDALRAIGIDLDTVRDAVKGAFGDDITEGWGERRGGPRRDRGPRGPRGRHGHHGRPGERREGVRREGPAEFGLPEGMPWGPPGARGPFDEGWGPRGPFDEEWDPRGGGRGRRGPRSRRFGPGRLGSSMHPVWEQVRRAAREGRAFDGIQLLLALMDAGGPVVEAMLAGADDVDALRADVERLAARPQAG